MFIMYLTLIIHKINIDIFYEWVRLHDKMTNKSRLYI